MPVNDKVLSFFLQDRSEDELLTFNFRDRAAVAALPFGDDEREEALGHMMALQRVMRVHPDLPVAKALVEAEITSAHQIAAMSKQAFFAVYQKLVDAHPLANTGKGAGNSTADTAASIYHRAQAIRAKTVHLWANLHQLTASPSTRALRVNNLRLDDADALVSQLPSYQEIFGDLNYCDCEECKSIFGAAAYLVDLLRIVDSMTRSSQASIPKNWSLDERREDISLLPLTCENTNTAVPYLQIVNQVLDKLARRLMKWDDKVDVYQKLAVQAYPFQLPFNLPVAKIRSLLALLKTDLSTVYQLFGNDAEVQTREALGLTIEEHAILAAPVPSSFSADALLALKQAYGLLPAQDLAVLSDVPTFLGQTGLSLDELHSLLFQNLGQTELSDKLHKQFYINAGATDPVTILTDKPDTLANLTPQALHRINRFIRLAGKLQWTFADLDWALQAIEGNDPLVDSLGELAAIKSLSEELQAPIDVTCSLFAEMKTSGVGDGDSSQALFDVVFNGSGTQLGQAPYHPRGRQEKSYAKNPLYTDYADGPLAWELDAKDDLTQARIGNWVAAGLRLSQDELAQLGRTFFSGSIDLTVPNLSVLYRHAKLAKLLGMRLSEYLLLTKILGLQTAVPTIQSVLTIVHAADWLAQSPFSIYQLDYMIHDGSRAFVTPRYNQDEEGALQKWLGSLSRLIQTDTLQAESFVTASINAALSAQFYDQLLAQKYIANGILVKQPTPQTAEELHGATDPVLASVRVVLKSAHDDATSLQPGSFAGKTINAELSKKVYSQLALLAVIAQDGSLAPSAGDGSAVDLSFLVTLLTDQVLAVLVGYQEAAADREAKLIEQIAVFLGSQTEFVKGLAAIAADATRSALPPDAPNYVEAFLSGGGTPDVNGHFAYVQQFMIVLSEWHMLVDGLRLRPAEIEAISAYPNVFSIPDVAAGLNFGAVVDLTLFKQLINAFADTQGSLIQWISGIAPVSPQSFAKNADGLAAVASWDPEQAKQLAQALYANATDRPADDPRQDTTLMRHISRLQQAFQLGETLGASVPFLLRLAGLGSLSASEWPTLLETADSVTAMVQSKFAEGAWTAAFRKLNEGIEERKRDVLLPLSLWLLAQQPPELNYRGITTAQDLSEYLLIDVEMSGCADISPIVQALATVQQYLQRCRLNLEPGVTTADIPEVWWEWMMNYRVWEANRKVFLYPENYLDPVLRSTKTSLFQELENQLLQSDITVNAVEDAYRKYIEGFSELAKLQHVDSYSCIINDPVRGDIDTLFLFARTETEPYIYYYCTLEDGEVWTEWQKIDITIHSAYITPVYAFSKLFLFWVEMKNTSSATIESAGSNGSQTTANQTWKASIVYSYYNFQGRWIQPQTLVNDQLVHFGSSQASPYPLAEQLPFKDAFEVDELYWKKVYALRIQPQNAPTDGLQGPARERISVMYGHFVETGSVDPLDIPALADDSNADRSRFDQTIYNSAVVLNGALSARNDSYFPINRVQTLNTEMQFDSLNQSNEYLLLGKADAAQSAVLIKPEIDSVHGQFYMIPSDSALYSNYYGDVTPVINRIKTAAALNPKSFVDSSAKIDEPLSEKIYQVLTTYKIIDPASGYVMPMINSSVPLADLLGTLTTAQQVDAIQNSLFAAAGDPLLFGKVSKQNAKAIVIKNKPNWFIVNNGDEAFLVIPQSDLFGKISDSLEIAEPIIHADSFIVNNITAELSNKIYQILTTYKIVFPDTGKVNRDILLPLDLNLLLGQILPDSKEQRIVRNILLNHPLVQKGSLVTTGVAPSLSEKIYSVLNTYNLIDDAGRVSLDLLAGVDLSLMLTGLSLSPKQIGRVRSLLFGAPSLFTLNYTAQPAKSDVKNPRDFQFHTVRITTSAVDHLSQSLFIGGIDALLSLSSQQIPVQPQLPFDRLAPSAFVMPPRAIDGAQVDFDGPYGIYYWEMFFQVPWMIAMRLAANQQFAEAQKWLQYIFNPTLAEQQLAPNSFAAYTRDIDPTASANLYQLLKNTQVLDGSSDSAKKPIIDSEGRVSPDFLPTTDLSFLKLNLNQTREVRSILLNYQLATPKSFYWQFQPFRNQQLKTLLEILSDNDEIRRWNDDPFDPHAIAAMRIGAYEKAIVMQYIDILIDWGDYMFAQDSWESITQATLLYQYAYDLLGPKPTRMGSFAAPAPHSFHDIQQAYPDGIPQFLIDLEHLLPVLSGSSGAVLAAGKPFNGLDTYFCVPENEQFLGYWDRVEDRLFKIRHCMNLAGITRQLALFQPPIDPMQLVKAAAAGNNVLAQAVQSRQTVPNYRFTYLLEKAKSFTGQVIQLGTALLSALEKSDVEQLELLRTTHEENMLNLMTQIKKKQIEEAKQNVAALQKSLDTATDRSSHYQNLISSGLSSNEQASLVLMAEVMAFQSAAVLVQGVAIPAYLAPNIFGLADGGMQFGQAVETGARISDGIAATLNQGASLAAVMGDHARRHEEWAFQKQLADDDIQQIQAQLQASQIRLDMAVQELSIHQKNIEQTKETEDFLKRKFTNKELFQWMADRISAIYFQTYKLALELAMAAQTAYQYELDSDDTFLTIQYWDSQKRGLLAGESLSFALIQMEQRYLTENVRRLEVEKTISLMQLDPLAFMELKTTGKCEFNLDEILFDSDFPGHYSRQIKSLSVSIPAIVSPYQNLNATLIQTGSSIVVSQAKAAVQFLLNQKQGQRPDAGLRENWAPNQQIAISRGTDDSGVFVLDFRDERYLPFEGTGAVSSWELRLPKETNRIAFDTLTDVILQVKYTALPGGDDFQQAVQEMLAKKPLNYSVYVNARQAFASSWNQFMQSQASTDAQAFVFSIDSRMVLPTLAQAQLQAVLVRLTSPEPVTSSKLLTVKIAGDTKANPVTLTGGIGGITGLNLTRDQSTSQPWTISVSLPEADANQLVSQHYLDPSKFQNLELVLVYSAAAFGGGSI